MAHGEMHQSYGSGGRLPHVLDISSSSKTQVTITQNCLDLHIHDANSLHLKLDRAFILLLLPLTFVQISDFVWNF
jgi:hypothetical protein